MKENKSLDKIHWIFISLISINLFGRKRNSVKIKFLSEFRFPAAFKKHPPYLYATTNYGQQLLYIQPTAFPSFIKVYMH